ncbi:MAG: hypothetical protein IT210_07545 [Armatimonadetes bacterium]|nr:hypothetical protein [Armatimonadota bacterium]
MPVTIEPDAPEAASLADLRPRGSVFPSPLEWRDQMLYFLLPDRFSDGREDERTIFARANPGRHRTADTARWREGGDSRVARSKGSKASSIT